jgi:hypothetical protein
MSCSIRLAVCLVTLMGTGAAWAQEQGAQTYEIPPVTTAAPVAHVYIGNGNKILAFSAAANGKLTPVAGSPFNYNISLLGSNGHYLFGFEPSSVVIDSLAMAANGALKRTATTNTEDYWPLTDCPLTYWNGQGLRVDHSGQNLYNAAVSEDVFCEGNFQSYKIDEANGVLTYLGETAPYFDGGTELDILGNNKFVYAPECVDFDAPTAPGADDNNFHPGIVVYQRSSNGKLVGSNATYTFPTAPNDNSDPYQPSPGFYCPITAATDPTNHIAMLLGAIDQNLADFYGPLVIATYTADANGNLTTTSTYKNMPAAETGGGRMRMSPSGKLLAVGGQGLEIFHFNGGSPAKKYELLLPNDNIGTILWDTDNHMYALGSDAKGAKLWIYTVTPTGVTEAPGSPYSIANAGSMYVQPL